MFIKDETWKGPTCRMCTAPVRDPKMIKEWEELKNPDAPIFCSQECIIAKYIG